MIVWSTVYAVSSSMHRYFLRCTECACRSTTYSSQRLSLFYILVLSFSPMIVILSRKRLPRRCVHIDSLVSPLKHWKDLNALPQFNAVLDNSSIQFNSIPYSCKDGAAIQILLISAVTPWSFQGNSVDCIDGFDNCIAICHGMDDQAHHHAYQAHRTAFAIRQ